MKTSPDFPPPPIQTRGRLNGAQRQRLRSLLDLMYTPRELAAEVGFTRRQIYRTYEKLGAPIERDGSGHLWINGKKFAKWYFQTYPKVVLEKNQAFCASCKNSVAIEPKEIVEKGGLTYAKAPCPHCGRVLIKFLANRRNAV